MAPFGFRVELIRPRRENTALRAELLQERWKSINVIPNAIITKRFQPAPRSLSRSAPGTITIVVISRLAYRKGVDLLVATAPRVCREFPNVRFVVGEHWKKAGLSKGPSLT